MIRVRSARLAASQKSNFSLEIASYLRAVQGRRQVKICAVDRHGERGARAYNGGLEAEPPAGSRG